MKKQTKPLATQAKWQNKDYVYIPSHATDVLRRFKEQFNWIPPSEKRNGN